MGSGMQVYAEPTNCLCEGTNATQIHTIIWDNLWNSQPLFNTTEKCSLDKWKHVDAVSSEAIGANPRSQAHTKMLNTGELPKCLVTARITGQV